MPRRLRCLVAPLGAAALAVLAACGPVFPLDPDLDIRTITHDGEDHFSLETTDGVTMARADAANTGVSSRFVFWRKAEPATVDQQSCATWVDPSTQWQQQGAALRIQPFDQDDVRAVTVTKNVYAAYFWVFNIHVMDSSLAQPYTAIGQVDLKATFQDLGQPQNVRPYPWRMCARVVGDTVSFLVWPLTDPPPAWGDPRYGGSATLPAGWDGPGYAGWYIGHVRAGEHVGFTDMSTGSP